MNNMKKHKCDVCGKPVKWGVNGCPNVKERAGISVLLTVSDGWIHYTCASNV
jgi:hypothetical protein